MFNRFVKIIQNLIEDACFFVFLILSEYEDSKKEDLNLSAPTLPPLEKKDCGLWLHTIPGGPPEEVKICWDDRGFTYIYIDGYRQLPVREAIDGIWRKFELKP